MRLSRAEGWALAASVLVAVGAFAQTVGYQFVYDDVHLIQNKAAVHSLASWREILTTPLWFDLYRPISHLSFALDWAASDGDPRVFHVVNVLLHALVSALVYLLARSGLGVLGAGAAALIFAAHPVHVEAVANLVGRAELLATTFTLLAALAYRTDGRLAAAADTSWRRGAASFGTLAALALGLGSKETAFAAPGVLLLIDWLEGERTGEPARRRFRRHWILWAGAVVLSLEWLWLRMSIVGALGSHWAPGLEGQSFGGRALAMTPVLLEYARLFVFPVKLSADYSPEFLKAVPALTVAGAAGFTLALVTGIAAVRARHRAPVVACGIAWMAGTLLIVSNLIVPSEVLLAERTLYLPSVGAVLVLGWMVAWTDASWRHVGATLAALAVGLGMARTVTRNPAWTDNNHFFPQLVRDAPGSFRSYWVAGALAYGSGDRERGEALVRRAITIYPYQPGPWGDLAVQLEQDGRWLEAARHFGAAYTIDSTDLTKGVLAARNYVRAGMVDSAATVAARMGRGYADEPAYYAVMAEVESARGRSAAAMTWRRRVAWRFPQTWQAWYVTAREALAARYCWEARRSTGRVRSLRPGLAELADLDRQLEELGCDR
ncbi:MAG TPA: hypothetical protein VJL31_14195 [Gemmatimonadales bacterium]|nr:hypothetical protein [Gemmatimonadales bacterium]